jgi:hypothetical protein
MRAVVPSPEIIRADFGPALSKELTMDVHLLRVVIFGLIATLAVSWVLFLSFAGFVAFYFHKTWTKLAALMLELGDARGELSAYKNHTVLHLKHKVDRSFLWFKRLVDKHLFLEYREGKLSRAIGDTEDLTVFPELTPDQIASIQRLIAGGGGGLLH